MDTLQDRLRLAMEAAENMTQRELASRVGISQSAVSQLFTGETRDSRHVVKIARELEVPADWLSEGLGPTPKKLDNVRKLSYRSKRPKGARPVTLTNAPGDLEVHETSPADGGGFHLTRARPIDKSLRPPGIANAGKVFAVEVEGDCMSPRFNHGDTIIVDESSKPRAGDDVMVCYVTTNADEAVYFLRQLAERTSETYALRKFNPEHTDVVKADSVATIWRVLTMGDMIGRR